MDRKGWVARSIIESALLKMLNDAHRKTRAELAKLFEDPGDREVGTLDGERIGTVALQDGRESWFVADEPKFRAWVEANFDDEIEWVPRVKSVLQAVLLDDCRKHGGLIDLETGAVEIPAGLERGKGAPMLVERPDKGAEQAVRVWLGAAAEQLGIEE